MNESKVFPKNANFARVIFLFVSVFIFISPIIGQLNVAFEADRWERAKDAIIFSDLTKVNPQSALTFDVRRESQWKVLDYETENGLTGKSISSGPNTAAPKVTLNLNKKGWYAIYVGLGGFGRFMESYSNEVRLKLTNDVTFQHRRYSGSWDEIDEVFFKAADLTGQNLEIAQMRMQALMNSDSVARQKHSIIMYVKLIPLTEKEVEWIQKDRADKNNKKLIATLDGFSWLGRNYPTTKEEFLEDFEHYRDSDFGTLSWQIVGGGLVNYKSSLGTIPGELSDDTIRIGDRFAKATIQNFIAKGEDPTKMAIEAARSMNKKIFIGFRSQSWQTPPALEDYFSSRFYRDHPAYRAYDRDGTPVMRMSYAVPQVREHIYGLVQEVLEHQPDGIEIVYFRGLPLMLWEDAFSNRFKEKYGADAKQVSEDDPRLYELRCEIMTGFMRDLRNILNEVQKKQGKKERYELMASVVHNEYDNKKYGLDVERWVKEGLINKIGIFPSAFHTDTRKPVDLEWFAKITKNTEVEFYPLMIGWRLSSYKDAITEAQKNYTAGAAGIVFWDPFPTGTYTPRPPPQTHYYRRRSLTYWSLVSRLGHTENLAELEKDKRPENKYYPLKRYGNYWVGRWIPDVGF